MYQTRTQDNIGEPATKPRLVGQGVRPRLTPKMKPCLQLEECHALHGGTTRIALDTKPRLVGQCVRPRLTPKSRPCLNHGKRPALQGGTSRSDHSQCNPCGRNSTQVFGERLNSRRLCYCTVASVQFCLGGAGGQDTLLLRPRLDQGLPVQDHASADRVS